MTQSPESLIGNAESRKAFEAWWDDKFDQYPYTNAAEAKRIWQAAEQRILEMLGGKDFVEHISVAIAGAYVLIPKDMPWESATEKLEEAVLAAIKERIGV